MLVRDVMSTEIVTVARDATLHEAVGELLEHGVGSVVVLDGGHPAGIVTEMDALEAVHEAGAPLTTVGLDQFCEGAILTTEPDRTVQSVARRMADEGVKKFPVMDDLEIVGIVTMTDIVYHLSDLRAEAQRLVERHYDWSE